MEQSRSYKCTILPCASPIICTSICFGSTIHFSTYTSSEPKAAFASDFARSYEDARSSIFCTIRIPRPPPPSDALIITGKPLVSTKSCTSCKLSTGPSVPGITGIAAAIACSRAFTLSPNMSSCSDFGPMKTIPSSSQRRAKSTFSDKKPYPG